MKEKKENVGWSEGGEWGRGEERRWEERPAYKTVKKQKEKNGCSVRMYERLAGGKGKAAFMFKRRQKKMWKFKKQGWEKTKDNSLREPYQSETKRNSWKKDWRVKTKDSLRQHHRTGFK